MATRTRTYVNTDTYRGYVWVGPNGGVWDSAEGGIKLGERRPNGTIAFGSSAPTTDLGDRTALDPETYEVPPRTVGPVTPYAPGTTAVETERPAQPDDVPPAGYEWYWNGTQWSIRPGGDASAEEKETAGVRASIRAWLQANFLPEQVAPAMAFIEGALTSGDPYEKIILDLQETQFFKDAYPELEARKLRGLGNVSLEYIRGYRQDAKNLAQRVFGTRITDQQIANLIGNNVSIEEFSHRLSTFKRMESMAAPVKAFFEEAIGYSLSDQDLYEWFDSEINTEELDRAYQDARVRGMPVLYGLKPRSQAEADAFRELGLDPDEVIKRFESVGQNADRFTKLASIQQNILQGLPENFGEFLKDVPNELLVQAEVFQNPWARARIQDLVNNEIARFNVSGGVQATQGQLTGLLDATERASYG